MRIAVLACVLVGVLSTTVRAQSMSSPRLPAATAADDRAADDRAAPRIAVEVILGGAGAIGGGATGFALSHTVSLQEANVRMMAGIAVGSWLGTSLGGIVLGGGNNWTPALVGALCGSAASLPITGAMFSSTDALVMPMVTMVALPLLGAVIGYEIGQALSVSPAGPVRRLGLVVGLAEDRRTLLPGIAGAF